VTVASLILFLVGLLTISSVWLSGSVAGRRGGVGGVCVWLLGAAIRTAFSPRVVPVIKALVLDALLQRRLYRQSRIRWAIHSMIFLPLVFRCAWGLIALLGSLGPRGRSLAWIMLDKNHPACAFLFDLTGVMIILGAVLAWLRRVLGKGETPPGLPRQDVLAFAMIGGVILLGFVLEGMRIAMTGAPGGAQYAFVGYCISRLFEGFSGLTDLYGYLWYAHAVLTGAFVAYLPFSRMFHIVMAPVVLALNAVSGEHTASKKRV
jgi:nitrate reductase gamma subunit